MTTQTTPEDAQIEIGDIVFEYCAAFDMIEACAQKLASLMKHENTSVRENAKDYLDAVLEKSETLLEEIELIHGDAQDE